MWRDITFGTETLLWQHQLLGLLSVYTGLCGPEALGHLLSRRPEALKELSLATQLYAGLVVSLSGLLPNLPSCLARNYMRNFLTSLHS